MIITIFRSAVEKIENFSQFLKENFFFAIHPFLWRVY